MRSNLELLEDAAAKIATYKDYVSFSLRLRECGFSEDSRENAPLCRWVHGDLTMDVMPLDEKVLGFSNIWYAGALKTARAATLHSGAAIRLITAPSSWGLSWRHFAGGAAKTTLAATIWKISLP